MKKLTAKQILDLPMQENDAGAKTIREYLVALARAVWEDGEGFSGKRPFGNGAWEQDLYAPLVNAGAIEGKIVDGYVEGASYEDASKLILKALKELAK